MTAADVRAAVAAWQRGRGTADDVTAVALVAADGDADAARSLMQAACADWALIAESARQPYRDVNGQPFDKTSRRPA